jgi:hypothetical protein
LTTLVNTNFNFPFPVLELHSFLWNCLARL